MRSLPCVVLLFVVFSLAEASQAQQASTTIVPNLINYSGTLHLPSGLESPAHVVGVMFAIYRQEDGGAPLWLETQNVTLDSAGHYTVLLGSTRAEGIPADLFSTQEQRWLGVQKQGEAEQPRVLLVSVPYAMKAADAETISGLPAAAFVRATPTQSASSAQSSSGLNLSLNVPPVGGSGTTNFIPIWTNSTALGNSTIYQTGGNVGIGNTHPAGTLDVSGGAVIRGTLQLPATGTATATHGFNSQPLDALASAFSSSTHAAVNQHFRWQAEPVANNTASPSGKFNLLFASGTATPNETGLSISNRGIITFATGQTLPTVTGNVMVNGNISSTGSVSGASANFTGNVSTGNQTVTGHISATGQLISTVANGTAPLSVNSTTQVANLNATFLGGFSSGAFAQPGIQNVFVADQFFAGNSLYTLVGDPGCGPGYAGIGFNGLSGCNNYSLIGNATDTFLNRTSGGAMHFREGNSEQVTIVSGGRVGIGIGNPGAMLEVVAPLEAQLLAGYFGGSSSNGSAQGADGVEGVGGYSVSNSGGDGIVGLPGTGSPNGLGGYFGGNVQVIGNLSKGGGSFKIDHPLDPANKYLYHSFVESPDMMNVYNGNVVLDANGEAVVLLPDWFGALNRDFRYQLTCIGGFAPVYIAEEIANNQFKIAGGKPGMKVSWQVTGIRQDAWANAHRIPVEEEKNAREHGYYLHPELYGAPEEKGIAWARHPELMKRMKGQVPSHPASKSVAQALAPQSSK